MQNQSASPASTLQIWDDPESKISFLETVMHGKNWKTDLHFPAIDTARIRRMVEIKEHLITKGYEVEQISHQDGHQILRVSHHETPQDLGRLFHDYGLVTGTAHIIQQPFVAAKDVAIDVAHRLQQGLNYIKDPARANGLIFLTSEAFITASSLGAKDGKWSDPKNLLLSVAGSLFLSQSATYLFLAKKGNERVMDDFTARLNDAKQHLGDSILPELASVAPVNAKKSTGLVNRISDFFNAYPIQIGAMANNLGMVAFLGAFFLERKFQNQYLINLGEEGIASAKALYQGGFGALADKEAVKAAQYVVDGLEKVKTPAQKVASGMLKSVESKPTELQALKEQASAFLIAAKAPHAENYLKKGYWLDSAGALSSILAWTFMLLPPKVTKEKSSNPIVHLWQSLREEPQKLTSAMALGSSSLRLLGSRERDNMLQTIGEAVYIPGDLMLWFTKNNEYGHSSSGNHDSLLKSATMTLNQLPVIMSAEREQSFLSEVATYLAKQSHALTHSGEILPDRELAIKAAEMEAAMKPMLKHEGTRRFDLMVGVANRLLSQFEVSQRPVVADKLAAAISSFKGVEAEPSTIRPRLMGHSNKIAASSTSPLLSLNQVSKEIADLVFTIPGPHAAENASKLYEALSPLLKPHCAPHQHLDDVMTDVATQSLGHKPQPVALPSLDLSENIPQNRISALALQHDIMQPHGQHTHPAR